MRVTCTNCGGAHTPWDCKRPAKRSTAALSETRRTAVAPDRGGMQITNETGSTPPSVGPRSEVGVIALPVDTNSAKADNEPHEAYVSGDDMPTVKLQSSSALSIISPNVVSAFPPKRPRGRPKSITDMAAYKRAKQREYRAKWKGRE